MEPKVWGKYLWTSIHIIALGYPDNPTPDDKQSYKQFYVNLWKVIPCFKCAQNYQRHLDELPIDDGSLTNNMSLFKWTVDMHNIVNKELGKRQWTQDEALDKFKRIARGEDEKFVSVDAKWDKLIWWVTVTLVTLLVLVIFVFVFRYLFSGSPPRYFNAKQFNTKY
jgi:hypothetical protein